MDEPDQLKWKVHCAQEQRASIHLSSTFPIHHALHCNSAAKAHIEEIWGVPKLADWMRQVTKPERKSKYIPSSLFWAANMILGEWICSL